MLWIAISQVFEVVFKALFTGTKHHKSTETVGKEMFDDLRDQDNALLFGQSCDHADHGQIVLELVIGDT